MATATSPVGAEVRDIQYAEVQRIIGMPIYFGMDSAEAEGYNQLNVLSQAYQDGFRLHNVQADAVFSYEQNGGGFFHVAVGWGKTIISLLCAQKGFNKGLQKILLLVPSQVQGQLVQTDIKGARSKVPLTLPIYALGDRSQADRHALAHSGRPGLYIMPYSYLSVKDTADLLDGIAPGLVICDEAHNLANRTAARTKRLLVYAEKHQPEAVMLSGTITSKTIRDYFHLIKWALRDGSPLPVSYSLASEWGAAIDSDANALITTAGEQGPLKPLIGWAKTHFPEIPITSDIAGFRRAYKQRLNTTPGVVSSGDLELGTSLTIANRPVFAPEKSEGWPLLLKLITTVTDEWLTPNGDEIEHSIHTWKWLNELSAGFYNELTWPVPDVYAAKKNIPVPEARKIIDRAKEHHAAGQVYASALRKWLQEHHIPKVDTPFLVGASMAHYGKEVVGEKLYEPWSYWHSLKFEGCPERDSRVVRVCSYKIDSAVEWAKALGKDEGALIWVHHQEVGEWLYEKLINAGVDAVHCPAGSTHNRIICQIGDPKEGGKGDRVVVASITAHGTGKNLQAFRHNYFVQWPRKDTIAEQTIGRTHRVGQQADELVVYMNLTGEWDQLNFAACLNDALYIQQSTGNRQKIIYANYDPIPKIFPSAVLKERGLEVKQLSADQQRAMAERFS
jgi:hypothetical protein